MATKGVGVGGLLAQYAARLVTQKQLIVLSASLSSGLVGCCWIILKLPVPFRFPVPNYKLITLSISRAVRRLQPPASLQVHLP